MMKSEAENIMKTGFLGLAMKVRVSKQLRDFLGVLAFAAVVCK
jgi:hypothetical protein